MAQSSDGKYLAVPCGNTVVVFDAQTGAHRRTFATESGRVWRAAFSSDGNRLAGAAEEPHQVRVWDLETGATAFTCAGHAGVTVVAFSRDGKHLASGHRDGAVKVWDAQTGQEEAVALKGHTNVVNSLAFSPDSKRLASANFDQTATVKVWDVQSGQEERTLTTQGREPNGNALVTFSPDGKLLAAGSDAQGKVWNAATFEELCILPEAGAPLGFTPDGQVLLTGRHDCTNVAHAVTRWEAATGRRLARLPLTNQGGIAVYQLSPDGKTVFGTRAYHPPDSSIHVYNAETGAEQFPQGPVYNVAVSPDGKLLASGGADHLVKLWDLAAWKAGDALPPVRTLPGHTDFVGALEFSPDGKLLASASRDKTVVLWDVASGKQLRRFTGAAYIMLRMAFSPDGRTLAVGCEDGGVRLWNLADQADQGGALQGTHTGRVRCVAFSPDATLLASGSEDRTVQVYDVAKGRRLKFAALPNIVNNVTFSPDGRTLAAVGDFPDGVVRLWEVATWNHEALPGHAGHVHGLEFSPIAPMLVTASHEGTVRFWDRTSSVPRYLPIGPGPFGGEVHPTFTPEGRYVVTGNANGTISVLRVPQPPAGAAPGAPKELPDPAELAKRPSAADALRREDIPAELLQKAAAAAGGEAPAELVAVLPHDAKSITAVAISLDGKLLASSGDALTAKIWDLATGKLLHACLCAERPVYDLAFIPCRGKAGEPSLLLATLGQESRVVTLWNAHTGEKLRTLTGHPAMLRHCVAAPDGRWFATSDLSGTIHIWEPATGKHLRTLQNPFIGWGDLAVSADGRFLAAAAEDGAMRLWDPLTGWLHATLVGHQGPGRAVAFHPDGRTLASTGNVDRTIRLWDLATLRQKQVLDGTRSIAVKAAWRADGRLLATDDYADGKVRLWDLNANPPRSRVIGLYPWGIHGIAMTPEGRYLATANADGTVYILKLAEPGEVFQLPAAAAELQPKAAWPAHDRFVTSTLFGDDGNTLISASKDGFVKRWNWRPEFPKGPGDAVQSIAAQEDGVRVLARADDGKTLATAGFDGVIRLWDTKGNQLHELPGHKGGTAALLFAANGERLLSGGADGKVRFWNVKDGKQVRELDASQDGITHLSRSKDGKTLATSGSDETVRLWDMDTAMLTRSIPERTAGCFAPAGDWLAVATRSGIIELRDVATWQVHTRLRGHTQAPECLSYSIDGTRLATCGKDGRLHVWDAARGHLLAVLRGQKGGPCNVAIAGDSVTVAAGDEDGRLLLWDLSGLGR